MEAASLKELNNSFLLPIEGLIFNPRTKVMHLFYPQMISLYEYLHLSGVRLPSDDKHRLASNIAKGLHQLHE